MRVGMSCGWSGTIGRRARLGLAGAARLGLAVAALLCVRCGAPRSIPPQTQAAAGDVSEDSAVIWARGASRGPVVIEVSTDPQFVGATRIERTISDPLVPVKVEAAGLSAGTQYYTRVTDAGGGRALGRFRTAHGDADFHGLRFGVSGDWRGDLAPYPSIRNAAGRDLDFFVAMGDTIYADYESPALIGVAQATRLSQFRLKYAEVYSPFLGLNSLADLRASTAWFATIDDHEVTDNFAGGAAPWTHPLFGLFGEYINETAFFEGGLRAFQDYHPIRDEYYGDTGDCRTAGKRKLYRYRTFGRDAAMFVLDARSFRDMNLDWEVNLEDPLSTTYFLLASLQRDRTMLGAEQFSDLQRDLRDAHRRGITWKFVFIPEPIQNLGPILSSDRYEGYAEERATLLRMIRDEDIRNVVFIAADIHGTIVNNLTYTDDILGPQIPVESWEVTTGAVAFDPVLGSVIVDQAIQLGILEPNVRIYYDELPRSLKDGFIEDALNGLLALFGYDPIGLQDSNIPATLLSGGYFSVNTFGWTEFQVDRVTQRLRVTTYGVDAYRRDILDPTLIPEVVSDFVVEARP
ncbi:MAG: hypothetical protein FLDDKLPJ_00920 [Phycisphaerae bacterium]|nr:hypothetical protein [Phycisphaerae bacterium]